MLLPALHPGERLQSTLDVELQQSLTAALKRLGVAEAAGVLVDNASGEVLAYVGAPEPALPDQAQLLRGAGNLLQPFAYGLAIERRQITAATPLEGATFVDLTDLYSARLRAVARSIQPDLDEGVYVQFRGPNYETPAEVQMAKAIGGHIVGMSTALEAIAARQAGMEILGFSLITNLAAGISPEPLSHAEVLEAGKQAEPVISELLARVVAAI